MIHDITSLQPVLTSCTVQLVTSALQCCVRYRAKCYSWWLLDGSVTLRCLLCYFCSWWRVIIQAARPPPLPPPLPPHIKHLVVLPVGTLCHYQHCRDRPLHSSSISKLFCLCLSLYVCPSMCLSACVSLILLFATNVDLTVWV